MGKLLEISNLHVEYRADKRVAHALNGTSFSIGEGEAMGLVGESGAGKTTTALSILQLLPKRLAKLTQGSIRFDGVDMLSANNRELEALRGESVAMIFQNPLTSLNPVFTVEEQIAMVLRAHTNKSKAVISREVGDLLELVGIGRERMKEYPNQFSGGMRQRVGIATALACNPKLVIADEPTTALDVTIQAQILELIKKLQSTHNSSLLMITHNLGIVGELCNRVAVMYAGQIIEIGSVDAVFRRPTHPYTKGLFASLPRLTGVRKPLAVIPGNPVDARQIPGGCPFHPRCSEKMPECEREAPAQIPFGEDHQVACLRYGRGEAYGE